MEKENGNKNLRTAMLFKFKKMKEKVHVEVKIRLIGICWSLVKIHVIVSFTF